MSMLGRAALPMQAIRGGDQGDDWVIPVSGYEDDTLRRWVGHHMAPEALNAIDAQAVSGAGHYVLSATATPADVEKAAFSAHLSPCFRLE